MGLLESVLISASLTRLRNDAEPMLNMEEVINRMSGHRFYSQMDLCKGYWQLGLSKRSRPYTAFETPILAEA